MKHAKIFIGCLMIILTSCCINEKSAPKTVTGTLVPGHEVRSFSEEGSPKSYWVVDKTGKLMSEYKKSRRRLHNQRNSRFARTDRGRDASNDGRFRGGL